MPMPSYPIYCYAPLCKNLATHKIASLWSDGLVRELKTYSLCCETCLTDQYRLSCIKQKACRLTQSESLETPGIYWMQRGQRDQKLQRLPDLELDMLKQTKM